MTNGWPWNERLALKPIEKKGKTGIDAMRKT